MPQMAPLSWVTLFMMFLLLFLATYIKIYFSTFNQNLKSTSNKISSSSNFMNWKW